MNRYEHNKEKIEKIDEMIDVIDQAMDKLSEIDRDKFSGFGLARAMDKIYNGNFYLKGAKAYLMNIKFKMAIKDMGIDTLTVKLTAKSNVRFYTRLYDGKILINEAIYDDDACYKNTNYYEYPLSELMNLREILSDLMSKYE